MIPPKCIACAVDISSLSPLSLSHSISVYNIYIYIYVYTVYYKMYVFRNSNRFKQQIEEWAC